MTMRKICLILVAVLFTGMAYGQSRTFSQAGVAAAVGATPSTVNETVGLTQTFGVLSTAAIDTSAAIPVPGVGDVTLWIYSLDSASIVPVVQYRPNATAPWVAMTVAAGDTLITTIATGTSKGYVLRGGTTNRIPGAGRIRFLAKCTTTAGTGSAYGVGVKSERE